MDSRSVEKVMDRRERGYIWLEKGLKRGMVLSLAGWLIFFVILWVWGTSLYRWCFLCFFALAANGVWCYISYRREYRNYQSIIEYLEAFEEGNYEFHLEGDMEPGIRSQLLDQLERMGKAFGLLKERLVQEKEGTRRLVTDISHQLKTPVSALGMSLELMTDKDITPEEQKEFAEKSQEEVKGLVQLLQALTNLSRLEAGMIRLEPVEGNLKDTIRQAVSSVWFQAEEKKIQIEVQEFADVRICHDPKWTAQAFVNVLENGVKYSPEGSKIILRVNVYVSYVFVEIEDEGIGIPKEEYAEIFKRFFRGKRPEVQKAEGAGVGLYLVRKILEEQGGSVRALPGKKGGTVFQMMLPLLCQDAEKGI